MGGPLFLRHHYRSNTATSPSKHHFRSTFRSGLFRGLSSPAGHFFRKLVSPPGTNPLTWHDIYQHQPDNGASCWVRRPPPTTPPPSAPPGPSPPSPTSSSTPAGNSPGT